MLACPSPVSVSESLFTFRNWVMAARPTEGGYLKWKYQPKLLVVSQPAQPTFVRLILLQ